MPVLFKEGIVDPCLDMGGAATLHLTSTVRRSGTTEQVSG